jgi:hypothetical protein
MYSVCQGDDGGNGTFTIYDNTAAAIRFTITPEGLISAGSFTAFDYITTGTISAGNLGMFRNRIINGDARVDQRLSATTAVTATNTYAMDRWRLNVTLASGTVALSQAAMPAALTGFQKCIKIQGTNAGISAVGHFIQIAQNIEGNNISDLMYGTANTRACMMSFWVYGSVATTYSVALKNSANNRSFVSMYTINTVNTWQKVSFTVPGDTTGTWLVDNSVGLRVEFTFGCGTTFQSATVNAWQAGNRSSTSATSSLNSAIVYITGVQFEKGTIATPFEFRPLAMELQLCQRYYEKSYNPSVAPGTNTGQGGTGSSLDIIQWSQIMANRPSFNVKYQVPKRAIVAPTIYSSIGTSGKVSNYATDVAYTIDNIGQNGFSLYAAGGAVGDNIYMHFTTSANHEL